MWLGSQAQVVMMGTDELLAEIGALATSLGPAVPLGRHVRTVPAPDAYRGDPDVAGSFLRHVQAALADLERHGA